MRLKELLERRHLVGGSAMIVLISSVTQKRRMLLVVADLLDGRRGTSPRCPSF